MPRAKINGINLNYEIAGSGKAVVLVHGYLDSSRTWEKQLALLSQKYLVIVPDMRGHGSTEVPCLEEDYSLSLFASDIYNLLEILNIRKCCLVGHSFGGDIATTLALEYPNMLAGLCLVGSIGEIPVTTDIFNLKTKVNEIALSQGVPAAFEYEAEHLPFKMEMFSAHPEENRKVRKWLENMPLETYVYFWWALTKAGPRKDRLHELELPILFIRGEREVPWVEQDCESLSRKIPNSMMVKIQNCGHSPQEDSPNQFHQALTDFLSKIDW